MLPNFYFRGNEINSSIKQSILFQLPFSVFAHQSCQYADKTNQIKKYDDCEKPEIELLNEFMCRVCCETFTIIALCCFHPRVYNFYIQCRATSILRNTHAANSHFIDLF